MRWSGIILGREISGMIILEHSRRRSSALEYGNLLVTIDERGSNSRRRLSLIRQRMMVHTHQLVITNEITGMIIPRMIDPLSRAR